MIQPAEDEGRPNIVGLQERRLGRTISRTYRTMLDLDDVVPNGNQPRIGPKEDEELQRQIEANEGLFESLLVEPLESASSVCVRLRRRLRTASSPNWKLRSRR
jgi:ParB family transcriptional regulator, chromosome partitioning protein